MCRNRLGEGWACDPIMDHRVCVKLIYLWVLMARSTCWGGLNSSEQRSQPTCCTVNRFNMPSSEWLIIVLLVACKYASQTLFERQLNCTVIGPCRKICSECHNTIVLQGKKNTEWQIVIFSQCPIVAFTRVEYWRHKSHNSDNRDCSFMGRFVVIGEVFLTWRERRHRCHTIFCCGCIPH